MTTTEIRLVVSPGYSGHTDWLLRVSPDQADVLRSCLEAEGLHVGTEIEHSAGSVLEILTVALGAGGAGTALVVALEKFLERHKDKSVTFGAEGNVETMTGYPMKDVQRVLAEADRLRQKRDAQWAAIQENTKPDKTDPT
ncbi:effector-associated constant component EACC1 [Actinophytocola algeriensis]|uniref:Uncharacterized protein n=1 Tax=Actinophytocola algeriensis TaxID=1768010 RepID=A0A7W7QBE5_9PSEU|nr:hypothetical protein [Actinophytocola algeriensis]MBB4910550.1 hypothetical protein [Actinophytocola algeriensis]MBE1480461.1 hypothetical protein [Actinophytocola algeriensis]